MEKKYANSGKVKAFFKRNIYYFVIGFCVLAIGAMITVALVVKDGEAVGTDLNQQNVTDNPIVDNNVQDNPTINPEPLEKDDPVIIEPEPTVIVFCEPVTSGSVSNDYTMSTVVYWSTLKHYAVHNGIDYCGEENAPVRAVYEGMVSSVSYDALNGNVVKIDHGNGLVTFYGSLDNVSVTQGQKVQKGTQIGTISTSASNEMLDGPHVHFAVYKDGKIVNPYDYLPLK